MRIDQLKRREFVSLIGSATMWPITAGGQQPAIPVIGLVHTASLDAYAHLVEGHNVAIEYRWAEGRSERFTEIATELVRLKVVVIVTAGGAAPAAKQATSVIPIVFAVAADPLGSGFVGSPARPGGNVTGLSLQQTDAGGKGLELLGEVVPGLGRLAIMGNAGYRGSVLEMSEVEDMAHTLGFAVIRSEIRRAEDIAGAIDALKGHADALYVIGDPLTDANRIGIAKEYVEAGGLMSYGPNYPDLFRRAADLVDKILRGAKPADLPVEQPIKFDLAIHLTTAKALGLTIPLTLLARADR
jgi:putative tryptophan/tyrosine transport system substrate-binding protein